MTKAYLLDVDTVMKDDQEVGQLTSERDAARDELVQGEMTRSRFISGWWIAPVLFLSCVVYGVIAVIFIGGAK